MRQLHNHQNFGPAGDFSDSVYAKFPFNDLSNHLVGTDKAKLDGILNGIK